MALVFTTSYLADAIDLLHHYKGLGEKAMAQCPADGFSRTLDPESNSIATIVKHLAGNMKSRFTDFLTSDGEKPWRDRDSEFEDPPASREEVLALWESGWACVFAALGSLSEADLGRTVTIRTEAHSVLQAIHRQVAHYSYHVGQIVFLSKHLGHEGWQAISVPRRQSASYNAEVAAGKKSQR